MTNSFTRGLKRLFSSDFRLRKKAQKISKIKKAESVAAKPKPVTTNPVVSKKKKPLSKKKVVKKKATKKKSLKKATKKKVVQKRKK